MRCVKLIKYAFIWWPNSHFDMYLYIYIYIPDTSTIITRLKRPTYRPLRANILTQFYLDFDWNLHYQFLHKRFNTVTQMQIAYPEFILISSYLHDNNFSSMSKDNLTKKRTTKWSFEPPVFKVQKFLSRELTVYYLLWYFPKCRAP